MNFPLSSTSKRIWLVDTGASNCFCIFDFMNFWAASGRMVGLSDSLVAVSAIACYFLVLDNPCYFIKVACYRVSDQGHSKGRYRLLYLQAGINSTLKNSHHLSKSSPFGIENPPGADTQTQFHFPGLSKASTNQPYEDFGIIAAGFAGSSRSSD